MPQTATTLGLRALVLFCAYCVVQPLMSQGDCDGYRYRYAGAFDGVEVDYDVPYGENFNVNFLPEELVVDVYTPAGDVVDARPLVVIAHGGFFLAGSNDGLDVVHCVKTWPKWGTSWPP